MESQTGEMFIKTCQYLTFLLEDLSNNDACLPSESFATVNNLMTKLSRLIQRLNNVKKLNNHSETSNHIYHHNGPSITDSPTKSSLPPLLHPGTTRNAFLNGGKDLMENYIAYQQPPVRTHRADRVTNCPTTVAPTNVQFGAESHPQSFYPFSTPAPQLFSPSTEDERNLTIKPGSVDQEYMSSSVKGKPKEEILSKDHKKMKIPCDVYITKKFDNFTDYILQGSVCFDQGSVCFDEMTVYCRVCDDVINGVWTNHLEDRVHIEKSARLKNLTKYLCDVCNLCFFGSKKLILFYFEYHFRKIHLEETVMSWDMAVLELESSQIVSRCGSSNSNYPIQYTSNKKRRSRKKALEITNKKLVKGAESPSNPSKAKNLITPPPKLIKNMDENPSKSTNIHSNLTNKSSNNPLYVETAVSKKPSKTPPSIKTPGSNNQSNNSPTVKTSVANNPSKTNPTVKTKVANNQSNNSPSVKTTVTNKQSNNPHTVKMITSNEPTNTPTTVTKKQVNNAPTLKTTTNKPTNTPTNLVNNTSTVQTTVTNKLSNIPPNAKMITSNEPTNTPTTATNKQVNNARMLKTTSDKPTNTPANVVNNTSTVQTTVNNELSNIPPNAKINAANKTSNTPPTAKTSKKKKTSKNTANEGVKDKKEPDHPAGNDPKLKDKLDEIFNAFPVSPYPEFDRLLIKRAKEWEKTSILIDMGFCDVCQQGMESGFDFLCHTMDHNECNPDLWTEQICHHCNFKVFGSNQSKYFDLPIHVELDKLIRTKW